MNPVSISSASEKTGECLYRYKPAGGFYARIKMPGKEIRRSLLENGIHPLTCF